jgi:hypothetical protein
MPLMSWAISLACANAYSTHQDACSKAMEASAKSTGVYQGADGVEGYLTVKATNNVTDLLGKDVVDTVGGSGYVYRAYRAKSVNFKVPSMGIADKVTANVNQGGGSLNFSWKFPEL